MERLQPQRVKGRFVNPDEGRVGEPPRAGTLREFLKWRRERRLRKVTANVPRAEAVDRLPDAPREGIAATWVGHTSLVLQMDGRTYLLDPVWSRRLAGVVERHTEPGLAWEALPRVDALVISHNHYDHLDAPTVKRLPRETPVFCPTGVGAWFRRRGFRDVSERSWWESGGALAGHRVTCVPAQHFSGRTAWDRDKSLWAGWVLEGDRGSRVYFAGDSGYFKGFRQIGEAFPDIHLALLPIGAYEPRWFMSDVHVDPEEAGQAFLDVGARWMLPTHWGAFRLADEGVDEPPRVLSKWWEKKGLDPERLRVPALGETVRLDPSARAAHQALSDSSSSSVSSRMP